MNAPFQFKAKDPITGKRRNPTPISEEHLPPRGAIDREVDDAARENRLADYEKLRAGHYAEISDKVPDPLPEDPVERAEAIASYGDFAGKEEFQRQVIHRLLARQFPVTTIATVLGVSVRHAHRLVGKLRRKYGAHAKDMRFQEYVGQTLWDFRDWMATVLKIFDDTRVPMGDRLRALRLVKDIKTSEIRFLHLVGFFEHGVVRPLGEDWRAEKDELDGTLKLLKELLDKCPKEMVERNDVPAEQNRSEER